MGLSLSALAACRMPVSVLCHFCSLLLFVARMDIAHVQYRVLNSYACFFVHRMLKMFGGMSAKPAPAKAAGDHAHTHSHTHAHTHGMIVVIAIVQITEYHTRLLHKAQDRDNEPDTYHSVPLQRLLLHLLWPQQRKSTTPL